MEKHVGLATAIFNEIRNVIIGKDEVIIKALTAFFADGHILLEDIPGVGKTTLAMAFANSMSLEYNRLQFTPDVLPSDVTGFTVYNQKTGAFEYKSGAVLTNLFLADEINRTSSKTQSALLEVMEEGKVTVDGESREMKNPFVVIATQNPVGSVGTQKLPESQLDRFMVKLSIGYPSKEAEKQILKQKQIHNNVSVSPVASVNDIIEIKQIVSEIYMSDEVIDYITGIVNATRKSQWLELGISPRGSLNLAMMSRGMAFMNGRNYVIPDDVKNVFCDVCEHRVILSHKAKVERRDVKSVLLEILGAFPVTQNR